MGISYAFGLLLKMIVCAAVAGVGGYWVVGAWLDRRLSPGEAVMLLTGLVIFLFLGVPLALRNNSGALALLFALAVGALAFFAYSTQVLNKRALSQMDEDDIATYREALDLDPNNVGAHSLLAKLYRKRGQFDLALQEYEAALKLDPSLQEERYWLSRLKSARDRSAAGEFRCQQCGAIGPLADGRCQGCGKLVRKPQGGGA